MSEWITEGGKKGSLPYDLGNDPFSVDVQTKYTKKSSIQLLPIFPISGMIDRRKEGKLCIHFKPAFATANVIQNKKRA